jgi:hypothetical protein
VSSEAASPAAALSLEPGIAWNRTRKHNPHMK